MKRLFIRIVVLFAIFLFAIWVVHHIVHRERRRIEGLIEEGREAVEARDVGRCMKLISEHYASERHADSGLFRMGLERVFSDFSTLRITIKKQETEVDGGTARSDLRVFIFLEDARTGMKGYDRLDMTVEWVKEEGDWFVRAVDVRLTDDGDRVF